MAVPVMRSKKSFFLLFAPLGYGENRTYAGGQIFDQSQDLTR